MKWDPAVSYETDFYSSNLSFHCDKVITSIYVSRLLLLHHFLSIVGDPEVMNLEVMKFWGSKSYEMDSPLYQTDHKLEKT